MSFPKVHSSLTCTLLDMNESSVSTNESMQKVTSDQSQAQKWKLFHHFLEVRRNIPHWIHPTIRIQDVPFHSIALTSGVTLNWFPEKLSKIIFYYKKSIENDFVFLCVCVVLLLKRGGNVASNKKRHDSSDRIMSDIFQSCMGKLLYGKEVINFLLEFNL